MKAMVLAAGKGTRLFPLTGVIPKPLAPVADKPVMQHIFELLAGAGANEVHVNVHYLADAILGRYGEEARLGSTQIHFHREKMLMGTAGGVKRVSEAVGFDEAFVVIMGDALTDIDQRELPPQVDGVFAIIAAFRSSGRGMRRPLLLIEGVIGILFGLVALFWPGLTALALLYIIAFWAILSGIARIVMAIMLRREIENEWSIALSGVLSVILGIVLILLPGAGLLAYTWLIGLLALAVGIALIYYAFRVRGQRRSGSGRIA